MIHRLRVFLQFLVNLIHCCFSPVLWLYPLCANPENFIWLNSVLSGKMLKTTILGGRGGQEEMTISQIIQEMVYFSTSAENIYTEVNRIISIYLL